MRRKLIWNDGYTNGGLYLVSDPFLSSLVMMRTVWPRLLGAALATIFRKCWIIIIGTQTKETQIPSWVWSRLDTFWLVCWSFIRSRTTLLDVALPRWPLPRPHRAPGSLSRIIVTRADTDHYDTRWWGRVNIAETMTLCHHETQDRAPSSNSWSTVQLSTAFIDIWNLIPSCFETLASSLTIQDIHFLLYDWKKAC